jgi:hypothetical protein
MADVLTLDVLKKTVSGTAAVTHVLQAEKPAEDSRPAGRSSGVVFARQRRQCFSTGRQKGGN